MNIFERIERAKKSATVLAAYAKSTAADIVTRVSVLRHEALSQLVGRPVAAMSDLAVRAGGAINSAATFNMGQLAPAVAKKTPALRR